MKRSLFLLWFMLSAVALTNAQTAGSDYKIYRDTQYPFTLLYPKDWTVLEPTHAITRLKVTKEDGLYLTDFNVNAKYHVALQDMTPEKYAKDFIDDPGLIDAMVRQGNATAQMVASGKTSLNNRDAFFVKSEATYRVADRSHKITVYQIMTIFEGNAFTLTFRAPTSEFDANWPIFKYIASSFVVRSTKLSSAAKPIEKQPQAAEPTFVEYRLRDLGTILIPVTMELQGGDYKAMSDGFSKSQGYDVSDHAIFQQKGLNELKFNEVNTYARVMISTDTASPGSYEKLTRRGTATPAELRTIGVSIKQELTGGFEAQGQRLLRWDGASIATVNGRSALKISYLRQLKDNPPVIVEMYMFQNYDRMHRLTISYREQDSAIWKAALERTKNSFTITNVR